MLRPFSRFCVMIGAIPESIIHSLSYEQQLLRLVKFLKQTVIPAIDGNTSAIKEIEEWINTLDLQDEVDKKLDEMVESGELQEIITQYLQINGILAFNTISDMVNATNLINGSVAKVLGDTKYNDGKGSLYKIRNITNNDIVDGNRIIRLSNSETLIAEKIPYTNLYDLYIATTKIGELSTLNTTNKTNVVNAINEVNNNVTTETNERTSAVSDLQSQISGLASGSPLAASSTADMTDTTKIYVNTTDGNWYYYNGTTWVSGGTYQSSIPVNAILSYTYVTNSDYSTKLPDLNNISGSKTFITLLSGANKPLNYPKEPNGQLDYVFQSSVGNDIFKIQVFYSNNKIYYRSAYNGSWISWKSFETYVPPTKDLYVGSTRSYTTIKSALDYINNNGLQDMTVHVDAGTYDLYQEWGGDTFFNSYNHTTDGVGLLVQFGTKLIFEEGAKVIFDNNNENPDILNNFSPFYIGTYGNATIENLHLYSRNCRYGLHDENGGASKAYKHVFKNCYINHKNTQRDSYQNCIGGGLGIHGNIEIESCIFENEAVSNNASIVSYHGNILTGSDKNECNIVIKDSYCKQGTFAFLYAGTSTYMTEILVCNNRINGNITLSPTRPGTDLIENMEILEYNNAR